MNIADLMASGIDDARNARVIVRGDEITRDLLSKHPGMNPITAHIVGGDMAMAEYHASQVEEGADPIEHVNLVGSYARFTFALDYCPRQWVIDNIADLWRGSDPDDTDQRMMAIWREAWLRNDRRVIIDGEPLPKRRVLTVYRGQMPDERVGIAWSLDGGVAHRFAKGAGVRVPVPGQVLRAKVRRDDVMGYLTERGESEVVVDPANLYDVNVIAQYERRTR